MTNEPKIYCRYTELAAIETLKENPRNPNRHPQYQLERLAEVIRGNGWRQPITISARSGLIVKGHGRYQAAKLAGFKRVPVEIQEYASEAAELADLLADNKIAELAEMDEAALREAVRSVAEIDEGALAFTGFGEEELEEIIYEADRLEQEANEAPLDTDDFGDEKYTNKVERPQYEIRGERPQIAELVDSTKAEQLIQNIKKASGITEEERAFLIQAAQRHLRFSYKNVAEYYAHASAEMQELMEESALVIIDYKDAIKNGYAQLKADLQELKKEEGVPET